MEQVPETLRVGAPYQVFINHRGPDVKKTLASLIYHRLTSHALSVFLDKDEIRTGDTVSPAILGAIQSASVYVAIFSKRYAESSWCLDELCWILKSHHRGNTKIIPVFSDVESSDLRHIERGRYAEAFENHQLKGRVATEIIQNWKKALNQASQICGLLFKTNESDYGEILEKIVDSVLKEVFKWESLEVARYPVGLDQAAEDFQNAILQYGHSRATTIVGIAGMGGAGKSTLAKHLYNLRRPDYSRASILCEVGKRDLLSLQKKLLRDLLGNNGLDHIDNTSQARHILRDWLPRLPPVFIVLDDVDNIYQIESLLYVDAVACGSLILITSRDKDLLRRSSAKTVVYDVKLLHKSHARELFCWHAFSQSVPFEELQDLVEEILKICGGLPLSLKVLGGVFVGCYGREYWMRQLKKLSTTLPHEIINSLRVSFEALDPEEKEVFLDIGCFLVGEEKELAIPVLEGLYDDRRIGEYLESLRQKCLVDFHYDRKRQIPPVDICDNMSINKIECRERKYPIVEYNDTSLSITMHDQIRELAIHIAREEFRVFPTRSSLRLNSYNIDEFWESPAASRTGSSLQVRGIRFWDNQKPFCLLSGIRSEGVRLFVFEDVHIPRSLFHHKNILGELVWLRLRNLDIPLHFSWDIFPSASLRRLRVLEIQGRSNSVEQFFDAFDQDPPRHLTKLEIVYTRRETLTDRLAHISTKNGQTESSEHTKSLFSQSRLNESSLFRYLNNWVTGMRTLTTLVLKKLGFLLSLPIDFSQLHNLRRLDLSGCSQLTELPNTFSQLLQLQYLSLRGCFELSIPVGILGEITTLEYVDFKGCAKLLCLPERIPYQRHLRYLNLRGTGLLQLPDKLGILDKLQQITIGSPSLKEIPLTVANLRGLTELFLIQCSGLQKILPEGIAAPNIKILAIDGCPIDNFSFQDQGNLDVQNIQLRVGMRFLRDLILTNTSISQISIPDCVSPSLETIDLSENIQLMHVNALPSALVSLNLQNCCRLKTLTSLSNLVNLKFLNINRCFNMKTLNLEGLASLEEIEAQECWELQSIQGLNQRERLNCLHISTDNRDIWNVICLFLRSPSHQKPSTAIFSRRRVDSSKISDGGGMLRIAKKFNLQMLDIFFHSVRDGSTFSHRRLNNFHLHSAILVCFITNNVKSCFRITFTPAYSLYEPSSLEYSTVTLDRGGSGVHVFMWTEESSLFKDYSVHRDSRVFFSHDSIENASGMRNMHGLRGVAINLDNCSNCSSSNVGEERGWILTVDKNTDVSEVCEELIMAWA